MSRPGAQDWETSTLQLYYYRDGIGNFGDDLNPWLWPRLLQKPVEECYDSDTLFLGIGSLLNESVPDKPAKKLVFGSGLGYGPPPLVTDLWHFLCVRGPLSAQQLGLPAEKAICDPAILVREIVEPTAEAHHRTTYMPHHRTARVDDWRSVCNSLSIRFVHPAAPIERTLETIRHSEVLITESLHGAVVADALRVPWIPVRTRPWIAEFKWKDWTSSLGIEHDFEWMPPLLSDKVDPAWKVRLQPIARTVARDRLRWLRRFGRRRLSADRTFDDVYGRLRTALDEMSTAA